MTNELLLKETASFLKDYCGTDVPKHDQIGTSGVYAYSHDSDYDFTTLKIEDRTSGLSYHTGGARDYSEQELAICFHILALAKSRVEQAGVQKASESSVELTLQEIADLSGVDVSRIKIVD